MKVENKIEIVPGRGLVTPASTKMRKEYLNALGFSTKTLEKTTLELDEIISNIESYVGSIELPIGLLGPLLFNKEEGQEIVHSLAATLEGALVASINRGARVVSLSGGFNSVVKGQVMTRVPMVIFNTQEEAIIFTEFCEQNVEYCRNLTSNYSNHACLTSLHSTVIREYVNLKFSYETGDAAGQNMTTTCTWHCLTNLIDRFREQTDIVPRDYVIEGNGSSDKKISRENINNGRGISVTATCEVEEDILNRILRTTSNQMMKFYEPSVEFASKQGMVGYNINVANCLAGIFAATGQDLGSLHESGTGILTLEKTPSGLKASIDLPNLVVGTVGGGTRLKKQHKVLELMGCTGDGSVNRFARIIAGFALCLELSTFAAIVSGEFAKAHEKLGRNRPKNWLLKSHINADFFSGVLFDKWKTNEFTIQLMDNDDLEDGILTNITKRTCRKVIGHYELNYTNNCLGNSIKMLMKSKALDTEVIKGLHLMSSSIDSELADLIKTKTRKLEYRNSHRKEIDVYSALHQSGFKFMPELYGLHVVEQREIFVLVQEFLNKEFLLLFNSENEPHRWTEEHIKSVIGASCEFHEILNDKKALEYVRRFNPEPACELYNKMLTILINEEEDPERAEIFNHLKEELSTLNNQKKNLNLADRIIHNDFNPRNIAIRNNGDPVIYDWELAVRNIPHRDIIEFLCFTLQPNFTSEELRGYLEFHRDKSGGEYSSKDWYQGYAYALKEFLITRVSFYEVAGIVVKYDFSERVLRTGYKILKELTND